MPMKQIVCEPFPKEIDAKPVGTDEWSTHPPPHFVSSQLSRINASNVLGMCTVCGGRGCPREPGGGKTVGKIVVRDRYGSTRSAFSVWPKTPSSWFEIRARKRLTWCRPNLACQRRRNDLGVTIRAKGKPTREGV